MNARRRRRHIADPDWSWSDVVLLVASVVCSVGAGVGLAWVALRMIGADR